MPATSIVLGLCAAVLLAVWFRARQKMLAAAREAKRWRRTLEAVAYEAANAANAIRGNVAALRHTGLSEDQAAHVGEIEQALERIGQALEQAGNPAEAAASEREPAAPRVCTPA